MSHFGFLYAVRGVQRPCIAPQFFLGLFLCFELICFFDSNRELAVNADNEHVRTCRIMDDLIRSFLSTLPLNCGVLVRYARCGISSGGGDICEWMSRVWAEQVAHFVEMLCY